MKTITNSDRNTLNNQLINMPNSNGFSSTTLLVLLFYGLQCFVLFIVKTARNIGKHLMHQYVTLFMHYYN